MICSVNIHLIIPNWKKFLISLAKILSTEIFVEENQKGWIVYAEGTISQVEFEYFVYEDDEYIRLLSGKHLNP